MACFALVNTEYAVSDANVLLHKKSLRAEVPAQRCKLEVFGWKKLAGTTGLEPATSDVTGRRSNQLSYVPARCRVSD
jgi:hypothetical protein